MSVRGAAAVARVEASKLGAQRKVWGLLAACAVAPAVFVVAVGAQSSLPVDTLFGRWTKTSGFAAPLVVLGFASQWALPAMASVVGGDILSSEDRYGTWKTVLTRSRTRAEVFAGKALAALGFTALAVVVLGASSVAAGVLLVGRQPLVGLSGTELPPGRAAALVALAWASALPPTFAFTALAMLLSAATRSSAAGVGLPVVAGLVMELSSLLDLPEGVRLSVLTSGFRGWHGLFTEHAFYGPIVYGAEVSAGYLAAGLVGAYVVLRRRDVGG